MEPDINLLSAPDKQSNPILEQKREKRAQIAFGLALIPILNMVALFLIFIFVGHDKIPGTPFGYFLYIATLFTWTVGPIVAPIALIMVVPLKTRTQRRVALTALFTVTIPWWAGWLTTYIK